MAARLGALVVGAGPVGLAAAIELVRHEVAVRIVDENAAPRGESRAIAVNPRTLELLEPSGASERLIAAGVRLRGFCIVAGGRVRAIGDATRLRHRFNFMLALPQDRTETILAAHLAGMGVAVERGVRVAAVTTDDDGATATLEPDGETIAADWLVGADGAHSTVRKALGIEFPGAAYPFTWSLADVALAGRVEQDRAEMRLEVGRPLLLRVPIGEGRHRLIANGPEVLAFVPAEWGLGPVLWQSLFTVSRRQAVRLGQGRAWLVGDAAHIHSPAGGRGMNLGIEDAATLAERIAAGRLDDWAAARHAKARCVIRETDAMQREATADGVLARRLVPRLAGIALRVPWLHDRLIRTMAGLE